MKKMHTHMKRKLGLALHKSHSLRFGGRKRRPKTFSTEAAAQEHAKKLGLKEYSIKPAKKGKKFQAVPN